MILNYKTIINTAHDRIAEAFKQKDLDYAYSIIDWVAKQSCDYGKNINQVSVLKDDIEKLKGRI